MSLGTPSSTTRQVLLGILFAAIGGALFWGTILAVAVLYRLDPGGSTPVAMVVAPPFVLGLWTGLSTHPSRLRLGIAVSLWAGVFGWFAGRLIEADPVDSGLGRFGLQLVGAFVVALAVRAAGRARGWRS